VRSAFRVANEIFFLVLMLLRSTSFASLTSGWTLGFIRTYLKWYLATVPPYVVFFPSSFLALLPFAR
jgi:hypothetical protein